MSEIRLILDTASNENDHEAANIKVVPLTVSFGQETFVDDGQTTVADFLETMQRSKVAGKSSCPSIQDWLNALEGSQKAIIIALTSALSGSYSSAFQAKQIYEEKNPGSSVIVVDSRSAGPEQSIILHGIQQLLKGETRWADLDQKIAEMRQETHLLFVLQSLRNLSLNGRVPGAVAKLAGVLKIAVIGTASLEGKFELLAKTRGMKRAIKELAKQMQQLNYQGGEVIIDHCNNQADAEKLRDLIIEKYPLAQITIRPMRQLCSFYAEEGGLMVGFREAVN